MVHLEFTNKGFDELEAFRDFPTDKVLGVGVVDAKNLQVETPEQIEARIRRALEVVPADRLLVAPDCGLGYFSRTVAYAKLRAMGQAAADGPEHAVTALRGRAVDLDPGPSRRLASGGNVPSGSDDQRRLDMTAERQHEVLGLQLSVGDHICGFYRKPVERDDILIPFLVDGLKAGDKCTCVVDSCTPDDVLASMSEHIEVEPYVSVCQLEVLDSYGTYLADGGFLPERMLKFWEAKARQGPCRPGPGSPATSAT